MGKIDIYFNEEQHRYTDSLGNVYTSVTTKISQYYPKFDEAGMARRCAKIGKNPSHPKYHRYKGKTAKQLIKEWDKQRDDALLLGNNKHNYLEDAVKSANGYRRIKGKLIDDKIYTVEDLMIEHTYGEINLDIFKSCGVEDNYPKIFNLIKDLADAGYRFYAEVGVYNSKYLISGLIDLLAVNFELEHFIIIDYKTNKADIVFNSGYFEKDNNGNLTDKFITREEYFYPPVAHLNTSVGNKYSLQLSMYGLLASQFGLKYSGNILCHIRHEDYTKDDEDILKHPDWIGKNKVDFIPMPMLLEEAELLIKDKTNFTLFNS